MAQRRLLYLLCLSEFIERFNYFGLVAILVLLLHHSFHFTDRLSFSLFAVFVALSYALLVVSGYISDRWLSARHSLLLGCALLVLGNVLLATQLKPLFNIGLAVIIMGTGLFKVTCTRVAGTLYSHNTLERERGFTWFYSAMNAGGMLGPVVYGVLILVLGWAAGFVFSACLLSILLVVLWQSARIRTLVGINAHVLWAYSAMLGVIVIIALGFFAPNIANSLMIGLFAASLLLLIYIGSRQSKSIQKRLLALLLLSLGSAGFFACSFQVTSSMTLFIQRDIPHTFLGWTIPVSAFSALDPLFVVVMAPFFVLLWKQLAKRNCFPFATTKIALGLALAALAFLTLYGAAIASTAYPAWIALTGLIMANVLLGGGEICLTPAVLAAINQYSPTSLQGTMTGAWFLCIALGGYLAGQLSKLSDARTQAAHAIVSVAHYAHAFIAIAVLACLMAVVVLLLRPIILFLIR